MSDIVTDIGQVVSSDVNQGTSVLTSRKCSSTPSLPQATTDIHKPSVAASDQAASDDNLTAKVSGPRKNKLLHSFYVRELDFNLVVLQHSKISRLS